MYVVHRVNSVRTGFVLAHISLSAELLHVAFQLLELRLLNLLLERRFLGLRRKYQLHNYRIPVAYAQFGAKLRVDEQLSMVVQLE